MLRKILLLTCLIAAAWCNEQESEGVVKRLKLGNFIASGVFRYESDATRLTMQCPVRGTTIYKQPWTIALEEACTSVLVPEAFKVDIDLTENPDFVSPEYSHLLLTARDQLLPDYECAVLNGLATFEDFDKAVKSVVQICKSSQKEWVIVFNLLQMPYLLVQNSLTTELDSFIRKNVENIGNPELDLTINPNRDSVVKFNGILSTEALLEYWKGLGSALRQSFMRKLLPLSVLIGRNRHMSLVAPVSQKDLFYSHIYSTFTQLPKSESTVTTLYNTMNHISLGDHVNKVDFIKGCPKDLLNIEGSCNDEAKWSYNLYPLIVPDIFNTKDDDTPSSLLRILIEAKYNDIVIPNAEFRILLIGAKSETAFIQTEEMDENLIIHNLKVTRVKSNSVGQCTLYFQLSEGSMGMPLLAIASLNSLSVYDDRLGSIHLYRLDAPLWSRMERLKPSRWTDDAAHMANGQSLETCYLDSSTIELQQIAKSMMTGTPVLDCGNPLCKALNSVPRSADIDTKTGKLVSFKFKGPFQHQYAIEIDKLLSTQVEYFVQKTSDSNVGVCEPTRVKESLWVWIGDAIKEATLAFVRGIIALVDRTLAKLRVTWRKQWNVVSSVIGWSDIQRTAKVMSFNLRQSLLLTQFGLKMLTNHLLNGLDHFKASAIARLDAVLESSTFDGPDSAFIEPGQSGSSVNNTVSDYLTKQFAKNVGSAASNSASIESNSATEDEVLHEYSKYMQRAEKEKISFNDITSSFSDADKHVLDGIGVSLQIITSDLSKGLRYGLQALLRTVIKVVKSLINFAHRLITLLINRIIEAFNAWIEVFQQPIPWRKILPGWVLKNLFPTAIKDVSQLDLAGIALAIPYTFGYRLVASKAPYPTNEAVLEATKSDLSKYLPGLEKVWMIQFPGSGRLQKRSSKTITAMTTAAHTARWAQRSFYNAQHMTPIVGEALEQTSNLIKQGRNSADVVGYIGKFVAEFEKWCPKLMPNFEHLKSYAEDKFGTYEEKAAKVLEYKKRWLVTVRKHQTMLNWGSALTAASVFFPVAIAVVEIFKAIDKPTQIQFVMAGSQTIYAALTIASDRMLAATTGTYGFQQLAVVGGTMAAAAVVYAVSSIIATFRQNIHVPVGVLNSVILLGYQLLEAGAVIFRDDVSHYSRANCDKDDDHLQAQTKTPNGMTIPKYTGTMDVAEACANITPASAVFGAAYQPIIKFYHVRYAKMTFAFLSAYMVSTAVHRVLIDRVQAENAPVPMENESIPVLARAGPPDDDDDDDQNNSDTDSNGGAGGGTRAEPEDERMRDAAEATSDGEQGEEVAHVAADDSTDNAQADQQDDVVAGRDSDSEREESDHEIMPESRDFSQPLKSTQDQLKNRETRDYNHPTPGQFDSSPQEPSTKHNTQNFGDTRDSQPHAESSRSHQRWQQETYEEPERERIPAN